MQRLGRQIDIIIYTLPTIAIKMYLAYIERRQTILYDLSYEIWITVLVYIPHCLKSIITTKPETSCKNSRLSTQHVL